MNQVRWGVLSTAQFGLNQWVPAMQSGKYGAVTAIASRQLEKAKAAAAQLGIARAYGSYEALLADPEIDAIYNPLPNHLHVAWSIKALEAGKHVLCEKPIALSAAEAQTLADAAHAHPRLKVMEAFMYRLHPQWQRARQIVASGGIGALRTVESHFSYFNADPGNIRNQADVGGGGLMDIGCYTISASRFLFGAEPRRVLGVVERDPALKTDRLASGVLDFGLGTATFTVSTQLTPYQRVHAFGTTGQVEVEIPFNAPTDRPTRIWHTHDNRRDEIVFEVCNQYIIQGDLISQAILNDTPVPTPIADAVANMRVIDGIFHSGQSGEWVAVDHGNERRDRYPSP
jgi:predicted dehydrogenase